MSSPRTPSTCDRGDRTAGRSWGEVAAMVGGAAVVFVLFGWLWQVFGDRPFSDFAASMWVPLVIFATVLVLENPRRRRRQNDTP